MSLITEHDVLDQKLRAQAKSWKSRAENALILLNTANNTIARLRSLNSRLVADAERLAVTLSDEECCRPHGKWLDLHADHDEHSSDCPLVLHRQLMAEINGEPNCTMEEK